MNKKESSFEKVVGTSPENESILLGHFKQQFDTKFRVGADGKTVEKEKSPDLAKCINALTRCMRGFLAQYDIHALDIRPDQVHFIDKKEIPPDLLKIVSPDERALGHFDYQHQWIFVFQNEGQVSRQQLAHIIVHEMIHFNSFGSLQIAKVEDESSGIIGEARERRFGLRVRSGGFIHFNKLNEAVTEELAIRFCREYFENLDYTKKEVDRNLKQVRATLENLSNSIEQIQNMEKVKTRAISNSDFEFYPSERERLHGMVNDIFEDNKDQFVSKDDVFKIFVDAMEESL